MKYIPMLALLLLLAACDATDPVGPALVEQAEQVESVNKTPCEECELAWWQAMIDCAHAQNPAACYVTAYADAMACYDAHLCGPLPGYYEKTTPAGETP